MGALSVVFGMGEFEVKSETRFKTQEDTLVVVLKGLVRITTGSVTADMGPCTMLYIPGGVDVSVKPLSEYAKILLHKSYKLSDKPRLLHVGFAVKTLDGKAVTCVHLNRDGVKLLLPAKVYVVRGEMVVNKGGIHEVIHETAVLEPPAELRPSNGRAVAVLVLGLEGVKS